MWYQLLTTYPLRNMLPTLALAKSKTFGGLALLTISMFTVFRTDRMSSLFGLEMKLQSRDRDSTMSSHSDRALSGSELSRCSKSILRASISLSSSWLGMSLTRRPGHRFREQPVSQPKRVSTYCEYRPRLNQDSQLLAPISELILITYLAHQGI